MPRARLLTTAAALLFSSVCAARAGDDATKAPAKAGSPASVSFLKDVAPLLVRNCIACHNTKKSESKYVMTTFAQLAKGGQQGEGITLLPGDPDGSRFIELLKPEGEPRMPWKQDPLNAEAVSLLSRWVKEGAKYDGGEVTEDWTFVLRRTATVTVPEAYPAAVPVTALAFSPDGTRVASSGYYEINLWKTADGTLDRRLGGLSERVSEIAYSPDGKWLATAGGDPGQFGAVRLWLAEPSGGAKPVRDLLESPDVVFAVAFSPDSKRVAAAGADRAVRLWEVESGKLLATIEDHADWVLDVAFSPDGKRLVTASRDKTCKVFDVEKRESLVTFPGHAAPVSCAAFGPDGKQVYSGGDDNQVRVWSPDEDGKEARQLGGFGGAVFQFRLTPDGKGLVACGADKVVRVFKLADGSQERAMEGHADWVYAVAVAPDGKLTASGSWDGALKLWSLSDGKLVRSLVAAPGLSAAR